VENNIAFVRRMVDKGGLHQSEYDMINHWVHDIATQVRDGKISQEVYGNGIQNF